VSITQYTENEKKPKIDQFLDNCKNQRILIKIRKFSTKKSTLENVEILITNEYQLLKRHESWEIKYLEKTL